MLDKLHNDLISKIQKLICIFIDFFHCREKVQDNKEFNHENSKTCCKS